MSLFEDFNTTYGAAKGKILLLVGGIKVCNDMKMQGKQQIEGYLGAKMWSLPDLTTSIRTLPSLVSPIHPQRSNPS
uniref:Uncharacterized protein n=1 Tax=Arundo donax TaxID=35708 RepID=A0A0A9G2F4_ARUDO